MLLAAGFQELDDCVPYSGKIVPGEQEKKNVFLLTNANNYFVTRKGHISLMNNMSREQHFHIYYYSELSVSSLYASHPNPPRRQVLLYAQQVHNCGLCR